MPKPLPTHNCPLRPCDGNIGPKAAGLDRKKVELSSVRLIMAEEGNRGEWKEKKGEKRDRVLAEGEEGEFEDGRDGEWPPGCCRGRRVRIRRVVMAKRSKRSRRKGRIVSAETGPGQEIMKRIIRIKLN
jgi:hypothetical protein